MFNKPVLLYDTETRKFEIIASHGKEYKRHSPLIITTMGTKTYLLDLMNICEYDSSTKIFRTVFKGDCTLNDACMDQDGTFWLASVEGLLHFDLKTGKCHRVKTNLLKGFYWN